MAAPSLWPRRTVAALALLVTACAGPGMDNTITKHDFSGIVNQDLAGVDLVGADLTGFPPDDMTPMGDMSRIGWTDKTFTTTSTLWSVWSDGSTVWAVGADTADTTGIILKSTGGGAFAADPATPPTPPPLYGINGYGAASPLMTVGGGGKIFNWSGTTWGTVPNTGTTSYSFIWIAPDGQAFAVGPGNNAKKQNGANWDSITGLDATAFGVWGVKTATGYTVYACGAAQAGSGRIWKYTTTGGSFVVETSGVPGAIYGITGTGENDLYAVGDSGVILHSTGSGAWSKQTVPVTTAINAITAVGPNEVYAVGDNGVVLHKYDASATTWVKETLASPTENRNFVGVWANASKVWVTGLTGAILTK
jgi:hypothetical protein